MNSENVYIAGNGKKIPRGYLEDPELPGQVRRGLPLNPSEILAAHHFNLKNSKGQIVGGLQETSPNPRGAKTLDPDMPDWLRQGLDEIDAALKKAEAVTAEKTATRDEAEKLVNKFDRDYFGMKLTKDGYSKRQELQTKLDSDNRELYKAQAEAEELRSQSCKWNNKLSNWRRDETIRRDAEEAALRAAAEKPVEPSLVERLSERLTSLAQKVTG